MDVVVPTSGSAQAADVTALELGQVHPPTSNLDNSMQRQDQKILGRKFEVLSTTGGDDRYEWAVAETQGRRHNMEDAHCVSLNFDSRGTAFFGVFDGHSGKEVAAFCAQHMIEELLKSPSFQSGDIESSLREAFVALDRRMADPAVQAELFCYRKDIPRTVLPEAAEPAGAPADHGRAGGSVAQQVLEAAAEYGKFDDQGRYIGPRAGSTAVVAVVYDRQLYCASAGDSRCVLAEDGKAVALTHDHKTDNPSEQSRVYRAGLFVQRNRVGGTLAMTRAMGDVKYKQADLPPDEQAVTAVPDTHNVPVDTDRHDFMILACDGVWDCMSRNEVVRFISKQLSQGCSPKTAVEALVDECLSTDSSTPASMDNITAVLVTFK